MDRAIELGDGAALLLETTCHPGATGWLHRDARGVRPIDVSTALDLAGPRLEATVVEITSALLLSLGERADEEEQHAHDVAAERRAECLRAAEQRLGVELEQAAARRGRLAA